MSWVKTTTPHPCNVMRKRGGKVVECGAPATHVSHYDDEDPDEDCDVYACPACLRANMRATAQDDQDDAFEVQHGFRPYATFASLLDSIRRVAGRLRHYRKINAPAVIVRNETAMLHKRVNYMIAYLKAGRPNG